MTAKAGVPRATVRVRRRPRAGKGAENGVRRTARAVVKAAVRSAGVPTGRVTVKVSKAGRNAAPACRARRLRPSLRTLTPTTTAR